MAFPNLDFCLMCEAVRPEVGGKLTILGFYGACPNVEIGIGNPSLPVPLALIAGWSPLDTTTGMQQHSHTLSIIRPDQVRVLQSPLSPLNAQPGKMGFLAVGFLLAPPYPFGLYSIRIFIDNAIKLDTTFRLRQAGQAELAGMGGMPMPVPGGLPN